MASNRLTKRQPGAAAIVAALLLPPLGIYLAHGLVPAFWIGVALTCLGVVPGIAFALMAVLGVVPVRGTRRPVEAASA